MGHFGCVTQTTLDSSIGSATDQALARIAVQPPYFGLENLEDLGGGMVSATIPVTPPRPPELGVIEAAQVARHLAILGSCAAALGRDDDDRHHYLATNAHYMRMAGGPLDIGDEPLRAEAVASWIDRRTARAYVKLTTADGQGLHVLDVRYSVLAPKMFSRLHPPIAESAPVGDPDEFFSAPVEETDGGLRMDCGPIPVDVCAGHFPDYPAAPVAIIMGQLCRVAGLSLAAHLNRNLDFRIEEGWVQASKLATAGQRLTLEASYGNAVDVGHLLNGVARADGEEIGRIKVAVSTSPSPAGSEQR